MLTLSSTLIARISSTANTAALADQDRQQGEVENKWKQKGLDLTAHLSVLFMCSSIAITGVFVTVVVFQGKSMVRVVKLEVHCCWL